MRVVTWNMQGAGTKTGTSNASDAIGLIKKGVDVMLLQEAGGYPEGWGLTEVQCGGVKLAVGLIELGTSSRSKPAKVIWFDSKANTQASHDRCSMGIIATSFTARYGVVEHSSSSLRPLIGIETGSGIWAYSIHAPSGNHNAAAGVAASLLSAIPATEKYVCAGDYNCTPDLMKNKGFAPVSTSGATQQKGNTLDYAIGNVSIKLVAATSDGLSLLVSDHYSQCFVVS